MTHSQEKRQEKTGRADCPLQVDRRTPSPSYHHDKEIDIKTLEAFSSLDELKIFYFVATYCQDRPWSFSGISEKLNAAGMTTARRRPFTYRVVESRLKALNRAGLVDLYEQGVGEYLIECHETKKEPEIVTKKETVVETNEEADAERVDARASEEPRARGARDNQEKNIYNKINKKTVSEIVDKVDFSCDNARGIRAELVEMAWEHGVHAELFDRAVAAILLNLTTCGAVKTAINRAKEETVRHTRSFGRFGKSRLWETWALDIKKIYDEAGYIWTPTAWKSEPRPRRSFVPLVAKATRERIEQTSRQLVETFEETVERLKKTLGINDFSARLKALEIRGAINGASV